MKSKFCILFVLVFLTVDTIPQSLNCIFSEEISNIHIGGYTPGYTCNFLIKANNRQILDIGRNHNDLRGDSQVEYIKQYINLYYNPGNLQKFQLNNFSSIFCKTFQNLKGIYFDKMEIQTVEPNSFENCKRLQSLSLNSNKICKLDENLLKQNLNLENVWLRNNKLTVISENFLSTQSKLKFLDLSRNNFKSFSRNTFSFLMNLKELYLQENNIDIIDKKWFEKLEKLEILNLSFNLISLLPDTPFNQYSNLKQLLLTNNKIKILNKHFFTVLQNLNVLDLSHNLILSLPKFAFIDLINIKFCLLDSNNLTVIHSKSFSKRTELALLSINDNKISAIDKEFIENLNFSVMSLKKNVCCNDLNIKKIEIHEKMKNCFEVYKHTQQISKTNNLEVCGKIYKLKPTVMNGQNISRGDFPWVATVETINHGLHCGGTVISKKCVITAAHCFKLKNDVELYLGDFNVLFGAFDLSQTRESGMQSIPIKHIHIHSKWSQINKSFDADIAILELDHEIAYNTNVQPICLMDFSNSAKSLTIGTVIGYGKDENGIFGQKPKMMSSPIINHNDCIRNNSRLEDLLSNRAFCGGYGNGTGVCDGDSGSGLVVSWQNTFYLRGIVSSSLTSNINGCNVQTHSIFTDALKFSEWIRHTIAKVHSSSDEEREYYDKLLKNVE